MSSIYPVPDLAGLDNTGCKVDRHGRLSNWADRPPHVVRPVMQRTEGRKSHRTFSEEEVESLVRFCEAAQGQDVMVGNSVFHELACLYPSHPWQAYENKWRNGKLPHSPRPEPYLTMPFPNLDLDAKTTTPDVQNSSASRLNDVSTPTLSLEPPIAEALQVATGPDNAAQEDTTYGDLRVDVMRVVLENLCLKSIDDLMAFLSQDWVIRAYTTYYDQCLGPIREADRIYIQENGKLPTPQRGRAQHRWKIDRVSTLLRSNSSRFFHQEPHMESWDTDDHDLFFMIQIVRGAAAPGQIWNREVGNGEWQTVLSHRALYLMEFLRWMYKFSIGHSREAERARSRKNEWIKFLEGLRNSTEPAQTPVTGPESQDGVEQPLSVEQLNIHVHDGSRDNSNDDPMDTVMTTGTPESITLEPDLDLEFFTPREETGGDEGVQTPLSVAAGSPPLGLEATPPAMQLDEINAVTDGRGLDNIGSPAPPSDDGQGLPTSGGVPTGVIGNHAIFNYKVRPSKTKNQQQGVFWLTEDAYKIFKNSVHHRLGTWGLRADSTGTCVLVPAEWATVYPRDIMDNYPMESWPNDEPHAKRLWLHIADYTSLWARACGWFSSWPEQPRRGIDLDQFMTGRQGVFPEMHGSHLCHHGLCIQPGHIVYEDRDTNLSRNSCRWAARVMRGYHNSVPEQCSKHDPPCLLQHASLTATETICIQIYVLSKSLGLPSIDRTFARPASHPSEFQTFETRLPLQMAASAVSTDRSTRVTPPSLAESSVLDRFKVRCHFCRGAQRVWSMLPVYWSHLKDQHLEVPQVDRLQEIRNTAKEYKTWIEIRGFDYKQKNPDTWKKMEQSQATDFSWEVVENWRLHSGHHYQQISDATATATHDQGSSLA